MLAPIEGGTMPQPRERTLRVRATVPTRVALATLAAVLPLAGCAASGGSAAAPSTSNAAHLSFHQPKTAKDAAYEYVQALAAGRT